MKGLNTFLNVNFSEAEGRMMIPGLIASEEEAILTKVPTLDNLPRDGEI